MLETDIRSPTSVQKAAAKNLGQLLHPSEHLWRGLNIDWIPITAKRILDYYGKGRLEYMLGTPLPADMKSAVYYRVPIEQKIAVPVESGKFLTLAINEVLRKNAHLLPKGADPGTLVLIEDLGLIIRSIGFSSHIAENEKLLRQITDDPGVRSAFEGVLRFAKADPDPAWGTKQVIEKGKDKGLHFYGDTEYDTVYGWEDLTNKLFWSARDGQPNRLLALLERFGLSVDIDMGYPSYQGLRLMEPAQVFNENLLLSDHPGSGRVQLNNRAVQAGFAPEMFGLPTHSRTLLDIAIEGEKREVVGVLLERGAKPICSCLLYDNTDPFILRMLGVAAQARGNATPYTAPVFLGKILKDHRLTVHSSSSGRREGYTLNVQKTCNPEEAEQLLASIVATIKDQYPDTRGIQCKAAGSYSMIVTLPKKCHWHLSSALQDRAESPKRQRT